MGSENRQSVGEILKAKRTELGLTLRQVEIATKIRGKYLIQLESGDSRLPNDVYTRGFVQAYANHLGLDGRTLARRFAEERGDVIRDAAARVKPLQMRRFVFTPQVVIILAVLAILASIALYLVLQFTALAGAPSLEVTEPSEDKVITGSVLEIKGHSTPGADIFINDSPIFSDGEGNFADKLALQDGVNTVRITAKNRLGKSTVVTRNILAKVERSAPQAEFPTASFDGVAVRVTIGDAAAQVNVTADGGEVFSGTMPAGTVRVFRAATKLSFSTSNAGVTNLAITNVVVAGKDLGAMGAAGEPKQNIEFAKDTNFP